MRFHCENCGQLELEKVNVDIILEDTPTDDVCGSCTECSGVVVDTDDSHYVEFFPAKEQENGRTSTASFEVVKDGQKSRRIQLEEDRQAKIEKIKADNEQALEEMAKRQAARQAAMDQAKEERTAKLDNLKPLGKGTVARLSMSYSFSLGEFAEQSFALDDLVERLSDYIAEEKFRLHGIRDMVSLDMYPRLAKLSKWKLLREGFTGADHMTTEEIRNYIRLFLRAKASNDQLIEGIEELLMFATGVGYQHYQEMLAERKAKLEQDNARGLDAVKQAVEQIANGFISGDLVDMGDEEKFEQIIEDLRDLLTDDEE